VTSATATIFRDAAAAAEFDRNGFVVVPFLGADQVERLREVYFRYHAEPDVRARTIPSYAPGFYASTFNNDMDYRRAVSAEVTAACAPALARMFDAFKIFYAGFLVKLPDANGRLRVHQDPTLVDEARFTPVNVWCPLQDVDDRNGALCVLPGSQRLYRGPRATSIPPPWAAHEGLIESRMTPLHLAAGSAVLFTQATLHASQPNLSDAPRITATMFLCHETASMRIAHRRPETPDRVDFYAQDDDFMFQNAQFSVNSTGVPQIGRYLDSMPYDAAPLAAEAIERLAAP
jgi:hypothetical protein